MTKEHDANLEKSNKVVESSANTCKDMTLKVEKLLYDVQTFMGDFKASFESNTANANQVITSPGNTLLTEKATLTKVRINIQDDNTEFKAFISSKIEKPQEDLATKSKIMNRIAIKTEKIKVLCVKLSHANQQINELKSKKAVFKSCVADVNAHLHSLIETRDSHNVCPSASG